MTPGEGGREARLVRRETRLAAALVLALAGTAGAQQPDETDPCAGAADRSGQGACWAREASRAELEMREAFDLLLQKLPPQAKDALRKSQKAWLEARDAQVALLLAIANPEGRHRWQDTICGAIAKRELTLARTRALKRLAEPRQDEECPL